MRSTKNLQSSDDSIREECVLELAIPVEDGVMSAQTNTNTEISNLMCHVCAITQESEKQLRSHLDNQHRIVDCRTCGKRFPGSGT